MNGSPGNAQLIQRMNRLNVLNQIRRSPYISRSELAQSTGLSLSSITNVVTYLTEKKLVMEEGSDDIGRVGRKGGVLLFNESAYRFVCINLGSASANIVLTNMCGTPIKSREIRLNVAERKDSLSMMSKEIAELISGVDEVLGIGVAVSGLVLNDNYFVMSTSMKWDAFDLQEYLEKELKLPVFVENVSTTRAVWQFDNQGYPQENSIFIDLDGGFGSAYYRDGIVDRSVIGEIGHTTIERNGEKCFCGNNGCLELMCSIERIVRRCNSLTGRNESFAEIAKSFAMGEQPAVGLCMECAEYLGIGFATLVNLFNPKTIVINQAEYAQCPDIIANALEIMHRRAFKSITKSLSVHIVNISQMNNIRGIAIAMCNKIFDIAYSEEVI